MHVIDCYASRLHYWLHLEPVWVLLAAQGLAGTAYTPRTIGHRRGPETATRPVLVASWADAHYMSRGPVVYVEHGAGQTYDTPAANGWAGAPGLDHVRLFVCPSEAVAQRWREAYPDTPTVAVGDPFLDRYHRDRLRHERPWNRRPVVCVTFHWDCALVPETRSAWPHFDAGLPHLRDWCATNDVRLVGHAHPRLWRRLSRRYERLGIEHVERWDELIGRVDVLVADNTSVMWEHASLDGQLVILNAPSYRRDVEHGGRFWRWACAGEQVDDPAHLIDAVDDALVCPGVHAEERRRVTSEAYAHVDGRAAERAVQAIVRELP